MASSDVLIEMGEGPGAMQHSSSSVSPSLSPSMAKKENGRQTSNASAQHDGVGRGGSENENEMENPPYTSLDTPKRDKSSLDCDPNKMEEGDMAEAASPKNTERLLSEGNDGQGGEEGGAKPGRDEGKDEAEAEDLCHAINSFGVIVLPVAITMIITSIVVVYYSSQAAKDGLSSYLVFDEEQQSNKSSAAVAGGAILNALVLIGAIAAITFLIVLLYKYNCMKLLVGYLLFASAMLLGYMGGTLVDAVAIQGWGLVISWPTFVFVMYNFAIVGVLAIFYQKGMAFTLNQCYLVATSVILAWQLSQWPEWTTWALLVALALYDLCAVLTPCGPLNALIKLIQSEGRAMPGLLYEANVPSQENPQNQDRVRGRGDGATTPVTRDAAPKANEATESDADDSKTVSSSPANSSSSSEADTDPSVQIAASSAADHCHADVELGGGDVAASRNNGAVSSSPYNGSGRGTTKGDSAGSSWDYVQEGEGEGGKIDYDVAGETNADVSLEDDVVSVTAVPPPVPPCSPSATNLEGLVQASALPCSPTPLAPEDLNEKLLAKDREQRQMTLEAELAAFYMEHAPDQAHKAPALAAKFVDGDQEKLWRLLEYKYVTRPALDREAAREERSIKLGLGDFVFYSVLVAQAANFDFTTMAATFVCILMGLATTLYLLSVLHKALPALPISIFLAVIFYFLTREVVLPYIDELAQNPVYA